MSYELSALSSTRSTCQHRWFSGRMLACHAGGPGSIPGRCIYYFYSWFKCILAAPSKPSKRGNDSPPPPPGEKERKMNLEAPGIDPGTSRMLSERSTI